MSEWIADIWVPGHPRPQGSMTHIGNGRMIHKPTLIEWRHKIFDVVAEWCKWYGEAWEPYTGAVDTQVRFYLPRARSNRDPFPTGRRTGDVEKLERAANDGISLGPYKLIADDSQVVGSDTKKRWAHGMPGEDGHEPGMRLRVKLHE